MFLFLFASWLFCRSNGECKDYCEKSIPCENNKYTYTSPNRRSTPSAEHCTEGQVQCDSAPNCFNFIVSSAHRFFDVNCVETKTSVHVFLGLLHVRSTIALWFLKLKILKAFLGASRGLFQMIQLENGHE